ncbi:hypothetical protein [Halobacterium rubrum]|uniref:hypothetical protein n=1 Tax=Halobacterium TaxID=2239 RepID=UPI001F2F77B6|nr:MULTISPECIES: hypothetical protein [Halobacterium]MDH5021768.1 hypothetical protein [Halobacterium rubrum]
MNTTADPSADFGLQGGAYMTRRELVDTAPRPEEMVAQMGIEVGDVIQDTEDGVCHVVTDFSNYGEHGSILLDSPTASNVDELEEGGISATLTDYYAKWRRGTLIQRAHWENWPTTVTGAGSH